MSYVCTTSMYVLFVYFYIFTHKVNCVIWYNFEYLLTTHLRILGLCKQFEICNFHYFNMEVTSMIILLQKSYITTNQLVNKYRIREISYL